MCTTSDNWTYTADQPCCLDTPFRGSVQVCYWPTPAPKPSVSTVVNIAGYTLQANDHIKGCAIETDAIPSISPSVVVAFESLQAIDLCGNVGPIHNSTTIDFNESELSTAMTWTYSSDNSQPFAPWPPQTFAAATWGDE